MLLLWVQLLWISTPPALMELQIGEDSGWCPGRIGFAENTKKRTSWSIGWFIFLPGIHIQVCFFIQCFIFLFVCFKFKPAQIFKFFWLKYQLQKLLSEGLNPWLPFPEYSSPGSHFLLKWSSSPPQSPGYNLYYETGLKLQFDLGWLQSLSDKLENFANIWVRLCW